MTSRNSLSSPRRTWMLGALVATTLVAAAGCAPEPTSAPTPTPSSSHESTREPQAATDLAPLRGIRAASGTFDHASIAAKIDNAPPARPQIGLEKTDLVFEELVEGGLTRYVAVWQSDIPALLGPVRSIRPMDPDIISPFGGIVAYSGGQERFVALMQKAPVYNAVHGQGDTAATFFRSTDKPAPHNVLVKAQELLAEHTDLAKPATQFSFASTVPASSAVAAGTPTATITYRFSPQVSGSWTYDALRAVFLRSQAGAPDIDADGAQLTATNVIVLRVPVTISQDIPKTEMIGSGEGWVSTGGATLHATWSKGSATDPITLVDDAGVVIKLAAGNSWIELVPTAGSVEFAPPAAG